MFMSPKRDVVLELLRELPPQLVQLKTVDGKDFQAAIADLYKAAILKRKEVIAGSVEDAESLQEALREFVRNEPVMTMVIYKLFPREATETFKFDVLFAEVHGRDLSAFRDDSGVPSTPKACL